MKHEAVWNYCEGGGFQRVTPRRKHFRVSTFPSRFTYENRYCLKKTSQKADLTTEFEWCDQTQIQLRLRINFSCKQQNDLVDHSISMLRSAFPVLSFFKSHLLSHRTRICRSAWSETFPNPIFGFHVEIRLPLSVCSKVRSFCWLLN